MRTRCSLWYCFRSGKHGLQVDYKGIKKVVAWYCDKHAKVVDEVFKEGNVKTKVPIESYEGLTH